MGCNEPKSEFTYKPDGYNFEINFPKQPTESQTKANYNFGSLNWTQAIYEDKKNKMAFAINYTTYPDSTIKRLVDSDLETFYDRLEDESKTSISGKVILSKSFEVDGLTGRQVKYELQGGKLILTSRLLLNGNQLYTWMVTNLKGNEYLKKNREFLEGLRIKN